MKNNEQEAEKQEGEKVEEKKIEKKQDKKRGLFGWGVVAGLVLVFVAVSVSVYVFPVTKSPTGVVARIVPYPAAVVGSRVITTSSVFSEYGIAQHYLTATDSWGDITPEQIWSEVLMGQVNNAVVQQLANQMDVKLSKEDLDEFHQRYVTDFGGGEAFASQVEEQFGISEETFKKEVMKPLALRAKLSEELLQNEELQASVLEKAESAKGQLMEGGAFDEVVTSFGSDVEADFGEETSFVPYAELPAEWVQTLKNMEPGAISPVVDTPFAYIVYRLEERKGEGDDSEVRLSLMAFPKQTLEGLVDDFKKDRVVWTLVD